MCVPNLKHWALFLALSLGVFGYAVLFGPLKTVPMSPPAPGQVHVVDGDTISVGGRQYRLVGFDTPETGSNARCQRERDLAARATSRLRELVAQGDAKLLRVRCACPPGTEGTDSCNHGRLCGSLFVRGPLVAGGPLLAGGRDVGRILIEEGLARPYVCLPTSCPPRQGWCPQPATGRSTASGEPGAADPPIADGPLGAFEQTSPHEAKLLRLGELEAARRPVKSGHRLRPLLNVALSRYDAVT